MKQLKNNIKYEWLLLIRNKFLVIPFAVNIIAWVYAIYGRFQLDAGITVENQFYKYFLWVLLLNLFIIGIIAVYIVNRDRDSKFEQLAMTYQVKNWQWLTSKWLVTQIYGLGLTILTVMIQVIWFFTASMTMAEVLKQSTYTFVQVGGALMIIISFGFLFAVLIPNLFSYLAIPALIIASIFLPFDHAGLSLGYDNPRFHLLTPFDFMFVETPYEGIWGIERVFQGTLIHQAAVYVIAILVFALMLFIFKRNRHSQGEKQLLLVLLSITMIVAIFISFIRFTDYNQAFKQYVETGNYYLETFLADYEGETEEEYYDYIFQYYDEMQDDEPSDFSIETSDLDILLKADHQLEATNQLTIKNNGKEATNEVFLTLNHQLEITECSSERELNCSIDGDFIMLKFAELIQPNEEIEMKLTYGGEILQYINEGNGEAAFIDKRRVFLPKSAGWYPLIGKRTLFQVLEDEQLYVKFRMRNTRLVEDFPTQFNVSIQSEAVEVPLMMSIPKDGNGKFSGTTKHGLELIGGNMVEQEIAGIRVISHPQLQEKLPLIIDKYHQAWTGLKEWFDLALLPETIVVLPNNQYYDQYGTEDFYLLNEDEDIVYGEGGWVEEQIANRLYLQVLRSGIPHPETFRDGGSTEEVDFYDRMLFDELFHWSIYYQMKQESFTKYKYDDSWGKEYDQKIELIKEMEKQGDEYVLAFTRYLYDASNELTNRNEFNIERLAAAFEKEMRE